MSKNSGLKIVENMNCFVEMSSLILFYITLFQALSQRSNFTDADIKNFELRDDFRKTGQNCMESYHNTQCQTNSFDSASNGFILN